MYRVLIQRAKEYIEMKKGLASRIRESLVATPTRSEDLHDVESTGDTIPSENDYINDNGHGYDTTAVDSDNEAEVLTFREKMDRRVAESDEPDGLEHAADIAEVYKIDDRSDAEASREAQKQVFEEVRYDPTEDLAELAEAQADGQTINRLNRSAGEATGSSIPANGSSPEPTTIGASTSAATTDATGRDGEIEDDYEAPAEGSTAPGREDDPNQHTPDSPNSSDSPRQGISGDLNHPEDSSDDSDTPDNNYSQEHDDAETSSDSESDESKSGSSGRNPWEI